AVIIAHEGALSPCHFPRDFNLPRQSPMAFSPAPPASASSSLTFEPGSPLQEMEEAYIRLTLKYANNNRMRAAEILGISLRTLYKRLADFAKAEAASSANAEAASVSGSGS